MVNDDVRCARVNAREEAAMQFCAMEHWGGNKPALCFTNAHHRIANQALFNHVAVSMHHSFWPPCRSACIHNRIQIIFGNVDCWKFVACMLDLFVIRNRVRWYLSVNDPKRNVWKVMMDGCNLWFDRLFK